MNPVVKALIDNYRWLEEENLAHPDVLLDQLASPELIINERQYVSFSSNNYLGLGIRPEVIKAGRDALVTYTNATSESRKLGGNLKVLEDLEDVISEYKGKEDTMIFATGLLANVGVISAITDVDFYMSLFYSKPRPEVETVIIGDQLNHRSIQMGIKLSKARFVKYAHCDMQDLEEKLEENKNSNLFIITDSVFSMDGDLAPLDEITMLAKAYNAAVMIDDAHGSGVFGPTGRGAAEHFGVSKDIDFLMGTLSKAFGGLGGFVSAKKEVIDMLKVNTSTYYFTSSLPASSAAGLIAAIKIAMSEEQLRVRLWKNVERMLHGLFELGLDVPLRF
ncbi:MAG TPA: aminotransferase class I/II-fold pyridoxal phosphate-dependent enzyme, partial [Patescibacteria group bacterium]|nr:aminotransferase class I/II-fold pyridoxal phosphate-dependent enzyme [Patescibacteria group bacterium]